MRIDARLKMWSRKKESLIITILFLSVMAFYSVDWMHTLYVGNYHLWDGVSTVGAERILGGDIPYRDFWTMYAPGHFYFLALLFSIFGTHLLVEVIAASVVCALSACFCYSLIINIANRRIIALGCASIFVAATYSTKYFWRLGSYPCAILLILVALNFLAIYLKKEKLNFLVASGLFTGAAIIFKHDIGGYTAIAIVSGLIANLIASGKKADLIQFLRLRLIPYSVGVLIIVIPFLIYFVIIAGPDMLQDLIVFPLTDFRYARPEGYPSLIPEGIYDKSLGIMTRNLTRYMNLTIPFGLFILGLFAAGLAVKKHKLHYLPLAVTFSFAFVLHYAAAHVQINTHIVTMSIYAMVLGLIFDEITERKFPFGRPFITKVLTITLIMGWIISLGGLPAYLAFKQRQRGSITLQIPKVSGFKVKPEGAQAFNELYEFINSHIPKDQKIFVGLHRHDIVIIGDTLVYFLLNRPNATRYQELHPAITDTAQIQQEIISDLQKHKVPIVILKRIFRDEPLEKFKSFLNKNVPQVGATELDEFIRQNYLEIRKFGPYVVWQRIKISNIR